MSYGPAFGGYMMPVDRRDIARDVRENMEGLWSWTPAAEGISEDLKKIEHFGSPEKYSSGPSYDLTVRGDGFDVPMDTWLAQNAGNLHTYGVQTWSPMIPESYPGLFWDPAVGKMSSQKEIMSRLKWPTMGGIPYQYNPQRRRGFMGIEYPLAGYGAVDDATLTKDMDTFKASSCPDLPKSPKIPTPVQRVTCIMAFLRGYKKMSNAEKAKLCRELSVNQRYDTAEAKSMLLGEAATYEAKPTPVSPVVLIGLVGVGIAGVVGLVLWRSKNELR